MRNPTLDVLRAVAIILVFADHANLPFFQFGWLGVDLFFVLSGFLVSGLLFSEYRKTGGVLPGHFLIRRGFKIYPQFYLFIAIEVLWSGASWSSGLLRELIFTRNYASGLQCLHTWSLAVEEHFYLLVAIVIWAQAKRGGENPFRPLVRWIPVFAGVALIGRTVTWLLYPPANDDMAFYQHFAPSHLRTDSLSIGVLLGYLEAFHKPALADWVSRSRRWLAPASVLCLTPGVLVAQYDAIVCTIGFTLAALGFAALLLIALHPAKVQQLGGTGRAFAKLGQVSYAFYLWHLPVLLLGVKLLPANSGTAAQLLGLALTFAAAIGIAFLSTAVIERPFLALRDRWLPSVQNLPLSGIESERRHWYSDEGTALGSIGRLENEVL